MEATIRFIAGATHLENVNLTLVSQDPVSKLPAEVRHGLAGHWQVSNGMDPGQLVQAAQGLQQRFGKARAYIATLEQLQVPLAVAREALGIGGLSAGAARNFRDKSRMKTVLQAAGVPCARHVLASTADQARRFAGECGYPLVVKPNAGAGAKNTFRIDDGQDLETCLARFPLSSQQPTLFEEFVKGREYSFDSVMVAGQPRWHSISRYLPSPLEVLENAWIQWCVLLPRSIDGEEFDPIRDAAFNGLHALGMETGLSHMEWFSMPGGRVAISEVGARPPGAQITSLLSYAHDMNFYRAWPKLMVFDEFEVPERRYAVGAAYVRGQGLGRIRQVSGLNKAQELCGDLVVEARLPRSGQSASGTYEGDGYIIVKHPETATVEKALKSILSTVRVELA
ncbi:MAG: ATP-grasp domain-containing protein [Xanthomonadales bacterium]|nr:ATP-grasp domain-containing protein [Xanthomonadales bacterium]